MRLKTLFSSVLVVMLLAACQTVPTEQLPKASFVLVEKSARRMTLFDSQDRIITSYRISLGSNPDGGKGIMGDGKTPEGHYIIDRHNPSSAYYLSMHISYPNADDIRRAKEMGQKPGGDIFIHGTAPKKGWQFEKYSVGRDWTWGCVSMTNGDIKQAYKLIRDGTPIEIRP